MPDFFEQRDANGTLRDWAEAFAALPSETPPGDGWTRLAGTLDARGARHGAARRERRTTWLIGLASAAVLVLAVWSPLSRWLRADGVEAQAPVAATPEVPGMLGPAAPVRDEPQDPAPAVAHATEDPLAAPVTQDTPRATVRKPARKPMRSPGTVAALEQDEGGPAMPQGAADPPATLRDDGSAASVAVTLADDPLRSLQTQSAQLEALVALARDEHFGNASSELLSAELDAGIATVDAALSQADLDDALRRELWQQRVDLLQQLAGVEATSRWLAAQGASGTSTLVSVH